MDKTPKATKNLISNMAANSQQFGTRMDHAPNKVNDVNTSSLKRQISDLTSLVRQMAINNIKAIKVCGICLVVGYVMDMCPTLQEEKLVQQANAIGGFLGQPQRKYVHIPTPTT